MQRFAGCDEETISRDSCSELHHCGKITHIQIRIYTVISFFVQLLYSLKGGNISSAADFGS